MITPRQITDIARVAIAEGLTPATLTDLRRIYPGVYFTSCLDDDIIETEPVLQGAGLNIYLVDGRQHCMRLTKDFQAATGVVLAVMTEDCVEF